LITSEDTRGMEVALRSNVAQCLFRMEDFVAAQAECNIVLQLDPNNPKVLYRRALIQEQLGCFGEAIEDVRASLVHMEISSASPLTTKMRRASQQALARLLGRVRHMDATRDASDFAFRPILDVSRIEEAAEVPYVNDFLCSDGGCDTGHLMLPLPDLDGSLISARPTAPEPEPVMPPIVTSRPVSQAIQQVASPASLPSTPPPTAPPPMSSGKTRGRFKKEAAPAPAGDWLRRSVRIALMQPPRRSPRLAALPRINYRL
jgi:hypothetical protein